MSSPTKEMEEPSSSDDVLKNGASKRCEVASSAEEPRPPAKRPMSTAVIEISDTESDDSDICAVTSYQASADEVKRIRGDYSSSSSSSSDYSSDSESPWEDDSVVIPDEKVHVKLPRPQLNPRANRTDEPRINPKILASELIENLSEHWRDSKEYSTDEVTLINEPFTVCLLHDLLENVEIINNIVDDMNTLDWNRKKMDLYEFHQTADLASLTWQRSIRGIYELLKTEIMGWVSKVTGCSLTSVSASCSLYGPGDHLLVHDDLLEDRRVAFILYLAPWPPRAPAALNGAADGAHGGGWAAHMGGALELLGCDAAGAPGLVRRALLPRNNMMALFQVSPRSYHQVSEVLSLELPRLSINGWFHGPATPDVPPDVPPAEALAMPPVPPAPSLLDEDDVAFEPNNDVVVLKEWLEPSYMSPRNRVQIQQQMERHSEACLLDVLRPDKLRDLMAGLRDPAAPWRPAGPANQCRYHELRYSEAESLPAAVRALLRLAGGGAWAALLHELTELQLRPARVQLQRWSAGDYSLLPPAGRYRRPRLHAALSLLEPGPAPAGARTAYLAPDEPAAAALVVVPPRHNALSLVYCDAGAAHFTSYLHRLRAPPPPAASSDPALYILSATYYEQD